MPHPLKSLLRETHPAHEFLESRIGAQLVEKPNPEMYCPLAVLLDGSLQGFDRCIGVAQGEIDSSQRSWLDVTVIAREQRGQQLFRFCAPTRPGQIGRDSGETVGYRGSSSRARRKAASESVQVQAKTSRNPKDA